MTNRLLTAPELAQRLQVPVSWVYAQSRSGHLPCVSLGRYRHYRAEAVDEWLAGLEKRGCR
jgi:excisionase family DNA binding protein